jgi:aryl sulfotransferase
MDGALPVKTHVYQHHTMDGTRWDGFEVRDDDIVIATPYKCGTTWMQGIVRCLVLGECAGKAGKATSRSGWILRPAPWKTALSESSPNKRTGDFSKRICPSTACPFMTK